MSVKKLRADYCCRYCDRAYTTQIKADTHERMCSKNPLSSVRSKEIINHIFKKVSGDDIQTIRQYMLPTLKTSQKGDFLCQVVSITDLPNNHKSVITSEQSIDYNEMADWELISQDELADEVVDIIPIFKALQLKTVIRENDTRCYECLKLIYDKDYVVHNKEIYCLECAKAFKYV